jgi:hypothetical protein
MPAIGQSSCMIMVSGDPSFVRTSYRPFAVLRNNLRARCAGQPGVF